MYAGNACEGISEFKATEQETFTTFKGALNNPSEKAIAERAFEQFIMKSALCRKEKYIHLVKMKMQFKKM